ncbi:MAG: hypothetical protein MUE58_13335, partial [Chitinophagaceae bacterium]|nr:hypothetical protein [Chitinophagaceae bacterium]
MKTRHKRSSIFAGLIDALLAVSFSLLTACGGNDRVSSVPGTETQADTVAAIPTDTKRQALVLELKRLKRVFHSGDKNQ